MSRNKKKKETKPQDTALNKFETEADSHRLEFLYFTLSALDSRRDAVDSRSNVILVLSTTIVVFFTSLLSKESIFYPENLFLLINAIIVALEAIISCIYSLRLISPLTRKRKDRKKQQRSLSWFYLVADMTPKEYEKEIEKADSSDIVEELSKQIISISKLVKKRYLRMKTTCILQYIVLIHLLFYIVATLLFTYFGTTSVPLPQ